jgi:NADPH:quinone reductase-like Zn-dependent oxidoreductase
MTSVTRLLVDKTDISRTRAESAEPAALAPGQARLRIERFGLTANNISYAATGDKLQYWQFFPAEDPWVCVPAWGFATVTESQAEGVAVGERIWGFWPMATELVLQPARVSPFGFVDGAAHRRKLPAIYNEYTRCAVDPMHRDGQEDAEAILRPMFMTSWLVDDFLGDQQFFGAGTVVVTSASSKTAYGTAFQLFKRAGIQVVGLTAARNQAFVESLGCYHRVLSYEQLDHLDAQAPSVLLDYAGSAEIRRRLHGHLGQLRHSASIGASHVSEMGSASNLPGPKPEFFFAPTQAFKRVGEWGLPGLMQRMGGDWQSFLQRVLDPTDAWLQVHHHSGSAAAQAAYQLVLSGGADARSGHVLML